MRNQESQIESIHEVVISIKLCLLVLVPTSPSFVQGHGIHCGVYAANNDDTFRSNSSLAVLKALYSVNSTVHVTVLKITVLPIHLL